MPYHHLEGALIVSPGLERLDVASADVLACEVSRRVRGLGSVVMDLHGVTGVDRSGLGALLLISKQLSPGSRLLLARCGHEVRRALTQAHLDAHLPTFDTVEDALSASTPSLS